MGWISTAVVGCGSSTFQSHPLILLSVVPGHQPAAADVCCQATGCRENSRRDDDQAVPGQYNRSSAACWACLHVVDWASRTCFGYQATNHNAQALWKVDQALAQLQHHTVVTVLWIAFLLPFQHAMCFITEGENVLCRPNVYGRVKDDQCEYWKTGRL